MSANRSVSSTSAPPMPVLSSWRMQLLHSWALRSQGPNHGLSITPPTPPKGAWHSLQRGAEGTLRKARRRLSTPLCSPVRICRHSSSGDAWPMTGV